MFWFLWFSLEVWTNDDDVPHLHDEAPGDSHGIVVTQVQSLKQLAVNRKHCYHDDSSNNNNNNRLTKPLQLHLSIWSFTPSSSAGGVTDYKFSINIKLFWKSSVKGNSFCWWRSCDQKLCSIFTWFIHQHKHLNFLLSNRCKDVICPAGGAVTPVCLMKEFK